MLQDNIHVTINAYNYNKISQEYEFCVYSQVSGGHLVLSGGKQGARFALHSRNIFLERNIFLYTRIYYQFVRKLCAVYNVV